MNNYGHGAAFVTGGVMAYLGLSPLFSSKRFVSPNTNRQDLKDLTVDRMDRMYAGLGTASTLLAAESVLVLVKRFMIDQQLIFVN